MPPPWTLVQGYSVWWGTSPARKRRLINVARSTPMLGLSYRHHIQPSNLPQMEAPVTRHSGSRSRCAGGPLDHCHSLWCRLLHHVAVNKDAPSYFPPDSWVVTVALSTPHMVLAVTLPRRVCQESARVCALGLYIPF